MPDITWQARDYLGRLVEVTGETEEGSTAVRVSPQELEAGGGEQTVRRIGPFNVSFDEVAGATRKLLASLEAETVVVMTWIEVVTGWDANADTAKLHLSVGPNDVETVGVEQSLIGANEINSPGVGSVAAAYGSVGVSGGGGGSVYVRHNSNPGRLVSAGGLYAASSNTDGATEGEANVYALIAEPSA